MKKEMSWRIFLAPYSSCSDDLRLEDFLCHSKYGPGLRHETTGEMAEFIERNFTTVTSNLRRFRTQGTKHGQQVSPFSSSELWPQTKKFTLKNVNVGIFPLCRRCSLTRFSSSKRIYFQPSKDSWIKYWGAFINDGMENRHLSIGALL